ncbi:hypothetical protein PS854_04041 [Pseudomonas fluorescens]|uniref:Uncharacterized protein n=1 Tax=Pseudomonas fluorescens TaxID=294 RepID=A0A5E7MLY2_PSEFL|nr:hypothetical protein PS854_04041 [Pseudomonas fluorescens]
MRDIQSQGLKFHDKSFMLKRRCSPCGSWLASDSGVSGNVTSSLALQLRKGECLPRGFPEAQKKRLEPVGAFMCGSAGNYLPSQRFSTSVALVPPKPKLLLITVLMVAFSRVLVSTGRSATSGSSSSMLAEPAMKLPSIISMQ